MMKVRVQNKRIHQSILTYNISSNSNNTQNNTHLELRANEIRSQLAQVVRATAVQIVLIYYCCVVVDQS